MNAITIFSLHPNLAQANIKRVLVLPLTIYSEKVLTYLNKGILEMMTARISQSASVILQDVLDPGKDPSQLGRDLGADHGVTGSPTLFGNSASIRVSITTVDSGKMNVRFGLFDLSHGDIGDFFLTDLCANGWRGAV